MSIYYWGKLKLFSIARPRFILIEWIVFVRLRKSRQTVFFVLKKIIDRKNRNLVYLRRRAWEEDGKFNGSGQRSQD
jgi:hypothetical protein